MRAEEEDRTVFVEYILGTVAVMHVPVDDQGLPDAVPSLRIAGTKSNIIEHTETHAVRSVRVMPRRARCAECILQTSSHHLVHRTEDTTGRMPSRLQAARADRRVTGAQCPVAIRNFAFDEVQVLACVAEEDLVVFSRPGIDAFEMRIQVRVAQGTAHGVEPLLALWMMIAGLVCVVDVFEDISCQRWLLHDDRPP